MPSSSYPPSSPHRPWRQIAEEIVQERDPSKLIELTTELNRALAVQKIDEQPSRGPEGAHDQRRIA